MTIDEPYDEDDLPPVSPRGKGRRNEREALLPGDPDEGDDVNRALAFQTCNDFGNANRLITRYGSDLIFVENNGWYAWDGIRWDREGGQAGAVRCGHKTAMAIRDEAIALKEKPGKTSPERIDKLFSWTVQSGNQAKVYGMLDAAKSYLTQPLDLLDRDPLLAGCDNGTILLSSHCSQRASDRGDYITRKLGVPYKTGIPYPRWEKFIERVMPDEDVRAFLQRIMGYALTGSIREQAIFIFYGTGSNGKSTFMNVMRKVFGDYVMNSPVSTFLAKREGTSGSEASPDMARLPGARLVTAAEPPEGARLDEGRIKEIAGGEPMTVRHLNQGFFEFRPKYKLIISTNHRPAIRGSDNGIWRRIRLVPWTVHIPKEDVDLDLESKLLEEAPGILQWILDGVEEWLSCGLNPPDKAIAAVESYRADEDPVGEFLKAKCEVDPLAVNPSTSRPWECEAKKLREAYLEWCKDEGLDALTAKTFGSKLTGRGIERRKSHGLTVYIGLRLNTEWG